LAAGRCSLKSRVIQQGYCEYLSQYNSSCRDSPQLLLLVAARPAAVARPATVARLKYLVIACAITKYLSRATALNSQHIDPPGRPGNYCQLVSLCLLRLHCTRLPLSMSPTALTATAGIVQVRIVQLN